MAKPPNIIIFMTDQWRGDWTGAAGHPYVKTPRFDAIAGDGVIFNQTFTTHPICGPARESFCTGWYPHTRGHRSQEHLIRQDEPHLFQYLKDAGYHIAWGGKNDMLEAELVERTVDTRLPTSQPATIWGENPYDMGDNRAYSFYFGAIEGDAERHRDVQVTRAAQRFLREAPPEPFCLWVNLTFPHPPYAAPEPWASMYGVDDVDDPITVDYAGKPRYLAQINRHARLDRCSAEHLRKVRAMYAGMITMVDELFGDLVETMHEQKLGDATAVFCLSDHGNYAGDYGCPEKWHTAVHDAIGRVPLGARLPGGEGKAGVSEALTQHIDVFATILELAGVKPDWPHFGRSLLPVMRGEADALRDAVFIDCGANLPHELPWAIARMQMPRMPVDNPYYPFYRTFTECPAAASRTIMVREHRWKYVWRQADVDELYDLEADPRETRNLLTADGGARADPAVVGRLRERMLRWSIETGDVMPVGIHREAYP